MLTTSTTNENNKSINSNNKLFTPCILFINLYKAELCVQICQVSNLFAKTNTCSIFVGPIVCWMTRDIYDDPFFTRIILEIWTNTPFWFSFCYTKCSKVCVVVCKALSERPNQTFTVSKSGNCLQWSFLNILMYISPPDSWVEFHFDSCSEHSEGTPALSDITDLEKMLLEAQRESSSSSRTSSYCSRCV